MRVKKVDWIKNKFRTRGLCYGFAATSFLASRDMLDLDSIQEAQDSLYKISNSRRHSL